MKAILFSLALVVLSLSLNAQTFSTNDTPVGMEHNVLFNATSRYSVKQSGSAALSLARLFDGKFVPSYTATAPTAADPTVIEIHDLPKAHTQTGAWVGWSTRYWQAKRFKIEGFDEYNGNIWRVVADYSATDYTGGRKFTVKLPSGRFLKLRFTFYEATGSNGRLGVSELYYIHPEAVTPYEGLLTPAGTVSSQWEDNGNNIYFDSGNVGIGTTDPGSWRLAVDGHIRAKEIRVQTNWADFVFDENYDLPSLEEVKKHIDEKGHLPAIPSAKEVEENGIFLGEMDSKLLRKIEELTLYTLEQEERIQGIEAKNEVLEKENEALKSLAKDLIKIKKDLELLKAKN